MALFKKIEEVKSTNTENIKPELIEPEEEWVWVEGYKGTTKDMQGYGNFQYELGVQYDMPEGAKIEECKGGFHFCLNLKNVYHHYSIGKNNRFFKVKGLVRKNDVEKYGKINYAINPYTLYSTDHGCNYKDKIVAKSIVLLEELTIDEIFDSIKCKYFISDKYKHVAIEQSIKQAIVNSKLDTLVEDGYSEAVASIIIQKEKFSIAHAVASQKELSMDVKILTIFCN